MLVTDFLSRFLVRFDAISPRRDPSWLGFGAVLVLAGAVFAIASAQPLGVIGGVLVVLGVVVAGGLREEANFKERREFDADLVKNFREVRKEASKGMLGDFWLPEVVSELERCSQAWVMVNRALARKRWIYRCLTKSWRVLWTDTAWAADRAMLEALLTARSSRVSAGEPDTVNREAIKRLQRTTKELESLAYHVTKNNVNRLHG